MTYFLYHTPGTDLDDTLFVSTDPNLSGRDHLGRDYARLAGFGGLDAADDDAAHTAALEWAAE